MAIGKHIVEHTILGVEDTTFNDSRYVNTSGDTMTGDLSVPDEAYGAGWDGSLEVPTKNAVYDKIQTVSYVPIVNTEAVILASTPTSGLIAYGTDTQFFYVADGTDWRRASLKFYTDSANPDRGYEQNNSKDGYDEDFITNKGLFNTYLGTNASTAEGGWWVDATTTPKGVKMYLNSRTNTIMIDFTTATGKLIHTPFATTQTIKVWNGMSDEIGINGRPIVNEYMISRGACPPPRVICGGRI